MLKRFGMGIIVKMPDFLFVPLASKVVNSILDKYADLHVHGLEEIKNEEKNNTETKDEKVDDVKKEKYVFLGD